MAKTATVLVVLVLALAGCAGAPPAAPAAAPAAPRDYTDPQQLTALISGRLEPYVLVDVRTPTEYRSGHIPTAVNIPVETIADKPPTADKAALVIVYCRSGARATQAAEALQGLGYRRVVNFGAVTRWAGLLREGDDPGSLAPS